MALLADKHRAREVALAAQVPVLPGSAKLAGGDGAAVAAAGAALGFPLLIKATGGRGGIGMQICHEPTRLVSLAQSVSNVAERAFGDGGIFLERYVECAHHVEVQVFGWGDGRVEHLFDRECSVQRRFQKVIEEALAPCLSSALRQQIAAAARRLAASQNYANAAVYSRSHRYPFY